MRLSTGTLGWLAGLAVGGLVALTACAQEDVEGSAPGESSGDWWTTTTPATNGAHEFYRCGSAVFPLSELDDPTLLEDLDQDRAEGALHELVEGPTVITLPSKGWFEVFGSPYRASYLAALGRDRYAHVKVEGSGLDWEATAWGESCRVVRLNRAGAADWEFDPAFDRPMPDDKLLHVLASVACASKEPLAERLQVPEITYGREAVTVTLFLDASKNGSGGPSDFLCRLSQPAPVMVALDGSLGEREVNDGATYPPIDRSSEILLASRDPLELSDSALSYTGVMVGDLAGDPGRGCAWIETEAGPRTIRWPPDTRLGFDPLRLVGPDGSVLVHEGEAVAVRGGRAFDDQRDLVRCNPAEFQWVAFEVQPFVGMPDRPPQPEFDGVVYSPMVFTYNGFQIAVDPIWATLEHGYITISQGGQTTIEGPTDWILGEVSPMRIIDPFTGEIALEVPAEIVSEATNSYMLALSDRPGS